MKIDLDASQQKLADGNFVGFKLEQVQGKPAANKTCEVKLGAPKPGPSKA
jgi:hypothetical protein